MYRYYSSSIIQKVFEVGQLRDGLRENSTKKSNICSHFFVFQYFPLGPIANETSMGLVTPNAQELDLTPSEHRDRCLRS